MKPTLRDRNPILYGALDLAEMGIPVFPLAEKSKIPAISKKQGGNGNMDATTDMATIIDWWQPHPNWNLAIRTGVTIDVVDVDDPSGFKAFEQLPGYDRDELRRAPLVKTSRGFHLWFRASGLQSRTGFLPKVDFRGLDASCTAPPSQHESGATYVWLRNGLDDLERSLDDVPELPEFLRPPLAPAPVKRNFNDLGSAAPKTGAKSQKYVDTVVENELNKLKLAGEGTRNHTLNEVAYNIGQICGDGHLSPVDAGSKILEVALSIGLDDRESVATIHSGISKGLANPRSQR